VPIEYRVDAPGVIRAVMLDEVRGEDLVRHALELGADGRLASPILLDARAAVLALSEAEIAWLADVVGGMRRVHGYAPVAFLADRADSYDIAHRYGLLMEAQNPQFAVFRSAPDAEAWVRPPKPAHPGLERHPGGSAPPNLMGWAKLHPAHRRRALRLDPGRWYPVVEQPAEMPWRPLKDYVWLDDGVRYRRVWAAALELRWSPREDRPE
jgi:hypothetical protein